MMSAVGALSALTVCFVYIYPPQGKGRLTIFNTFLEDLTSKIS